MNSVRNILLIKSLYVCGVTARMISNFSYEDAVQKLNMLQSNKASIEQIRKEIKIGQKCTNLEDMERYLLRTGITLKMLDGLSVIHVAGTKGKGSTSAMCESILRHHGYKTGFYSSPHLVAVCERIRLGERVISKEKFAKYFHQIFHLLDNTKTYEDDMPKYFAFLTVLAYNIFLKEKVDVAVIEVGIGGAVDYTNVLRKVPVVGITSLGLDHTSILGNTIEQIAEAKAGIMKPGCEAYTVKQDSNAMNILYKVANDVKCPLHIVPDYKYYLFPDNLKSDDHLPIKLEAYYNNASLAVQLSHAWMRIKHNNITKSKTKTEILKNGKKVNEFLDIANEIVIKNSKLKESNDKTMIIKELPTETVLGLSNCRWPGRYQTILLEHARFYLDGAHTKESMEICASWYRNQNRCHHKCLIFSATGDRDAEVLLKPLADIDFDTVYFVIPTAFKEIDKKHDNYSALEQAELLSRCQKNATIWQNLSKIKSNVLVLECVFDALKEIKKNDPAQSVLVTGSLHLVGATLSIIDHNLKSM